MRGFAFFGNHKRNDPYRLTPKNPKPTDETLATGDAGKDGYTVLSKADPNRAGSPPPVGGNPVYQGPDNSFEQ